MIMLYASPYSNIVNGLLPGANEPLFYQLFSRQIHTNRTNLTNFESQYLGNNMNFVTWFLAKDISLRGLEIPRCFTLKLFRRKLVRSILVLSTDRINMKTNVGLDDNTHGITQIMLLSSKNICLQNTFVNTVLKLLGLSLKIDTFLNSTHILFSIFVSSSDSQIAACCLVL